MNSKKFIKYGLLGLGGLALVVAAVWFFVFSGFFKNNEELTVEDWGENSEVTYIKFDGSNISASNDSVLVSGTTMTIKNAGTYEITGHLDDGQIVVNTAKTSGVVLTLNEVSIYSSTSAPIYVKQAGEIVITNVAGTANSLTDKSARTSNTSINSALYADCDLTIVGEGSLTITGNFEDGIASTDDLKIKSTNVVVTSKGDGVRGKDSVQITDSNLTISSVDDAIKTTNTENQDDGFIEIENSHLKLTTAGNSTSSAKGIKATTSIKFEGGTIIINSIDDAIHANDITISSGEFNISTGDDGIHADNVLTINGGLIAIEKSYEGLEATTVNIAGGEIDITATDDGINAAGGNDTNAGNSGRYGGDRFSNSTGTLNISGGYVRINCNGDGLDSNGDINMSGGTALVNGPTNSGNGAIDYEKNFNITGGTLIAIGASGMAEAPSNTSSQYSIKFNINAQSTGSTIKLVDSSGNEIISMSSLKSYSSVVISTPKLQKGNTYSLVVDSVTLASVTTNSAVTTYGTSGGMNGGMR